MSKEIENLNSEQWKNVAEKLAEYIQGLCYYIESCYDCPFRNDSGCREDIDNLKSFVIRKAKKELGYE